MPTNSSDGPATGQVPFEDVNLFSSDAALMAAVEREGGGAARPGLNAFGIHAGSADARMVAALANRHVPALETHDRFGAPRDIVRYHPAYHELMETSVSEGLHASPWISLGDTGTAGRYGAHVARAGALYMAAQLEPGHCCPLSMTHAAIPLVAASDTLAPRWLPLLLSRSYDSRDEPAFEKRGVLFGMAMTERAGGSDLAGLETRAEPTGEHGQYVVTGEKWFLSAPMSDAFMVLARSPAGISCFLVPRFTPDGRRNGVRLQRLKDKLGNRANATAVASFEGSLGTLAGAEGRGVATIMEMVGYCRLDCAVSSAGLMRSSLAEAIHHARHRSVSGRSLLAAPLMREVLADLALEVEAATALAFRLARSFDHMSDARAAAWQRLMTPVTKYWVTKIAPCVIAEAMECLGGAGYVEDFPLARLYREAPVNAIWEGSGNVMALDVLGVLQRAPEVVEQVMDELDAAAGDDPHLRAEHARVAGLLHEPRLLDRRARTLAEGLARLAAGTILRRHAPAAVADAFIATRMGQLSRQTYGQGLDWADTNAIIDRADPGAL